MAEFRTQPPEVVPTGEVMQPIAGILDLTQHPGFETLREINKASLLEPPHLTHYLQREAGDALLPNVEGLVRLPTVYGFDMTMNLDGTRGRSLAGSIERNLFYLGTYEPGTLDVMGQMMARRGHGSTFVDVGAHIGTMSRFALQQDPEATVVAFEPNPASYALFEQNTADANSDQSVVPVPFVLGNAAGSARLVLDERNSGRVVTERSTDTQSGDVPVTTLDAALDEFNVSGRVDVLKIDVEGAELDVLQGAEQTIASHRPDLIVEVDGLQENPEIMALLEKYGYKIFILSGSRHFISDLVPYPQPDIRRRTENLFCFAPNIAGAEIPPIELDSTWITK